MVQRTNWQHLGGRSPNHFSYQGNELGVCGSGFFTEYAPGKSTPLHRHPYPEIFVVIEGTARFVAGEECFEAEQGEVIVVPANTAHRFENSGTGRLLVASVHSSPVIEQENLAD